MFQFIRSIYAIIYNKIMTLISPKLTLKANLSCNLMNGICIISYELNNGAEG